MKAFVVFESLFGNTARVAEGIAAGLRDRGLDATAVPITEVDEQASAEVSLLVVGGPTHVHGMSRPSTRAVAARDTKNTYPNPTVTPGLREWLAALPSRREIPVAVFDTRIDAPIAFTGSAAKGLARRMRGMGFSLVVKPESFLVTKDNHLIPGEIERTDVWAGHIVAALADLAPAR